MRESNITLQQGLEAFYKEHHPYLSHYKEGISSEAKTFLKFHDIAHVLFGCNISVFGEGSVKLWTIFGTTLGFWEHIRAYHQASAFELSKNFSLSDYCYNLGKLLLATPSLIIRAKK